MSDKYSQLREVYEAELQETGRNFAKGHSFEAWVEHRRTIAEGSILERNARLRARGVSPVETTRTRARHTPPQ